MNHRMVEPLRILLLGNISPFRIGGAETQARLLAERFVLRGHAVTVAGYANPRRQLAVCGSGHRTMDSRPLRSAGRHRLARALSYAGSLTGFLLSGRDRFDIILAYMLGESDLVVSLLKQMRLVNTQLVACSAGFGEGGDAWRLRHLPLSRLLIPLLQRQCNAINIVSPHIEEELSGLGLRNRFARIANGVPVPDSAIPAVPGDADAPSFLFAGRLVALKGCADLLVAVRRLRRAGYAFHVNIVGDGPEAGSLRKKAVRYGIDDVVHFHGEVLPDQMARHYRANTILVLPSLREAQGMVVAEAMSFGLPVIVTRSGGPEFTVDERMARICPPGNPAGLAAAMEELLRLPPGKLAAMGAAGREHVRRNFDIETVADRYIDLFYRLVRERGVRFR